MTMADSESPKLIRKASKASLHKTDSRVSIDSKFKMTMADSEPPKLIRKASKASLHKTDSRLSIDTKFKIRDIQHLLKEDPVDGSHNVLERAVVGRLQADKTKEKDTKKMYKGKKKVKGKHELKEETIDTELKKSFWSREHGAVAKRESFRNSVFDKVKEALKIACADGVTRLDIDNVTPLMKCLNISTTNESFIDLIRHSIIESLQIVSVPVMGSSESRLSALSLPLTTANKGKYNIAEQLSNSCEIVPMELDALVMKTQEDKQLVDIDECLEGAFNLIDFDEDGFITQKDIKELLQKLDQELCDYAVQEMLEVGDVDKDGKISLSDFRHFLLGRDVPLTEDIKPKSGVLSELPEEKKKVKYSVESQEVIGDGISDKVSNVVDKNTNNTFSKMQSVVTGLRLTPSMKAPATRSEAGLAVVGDVLRSGAVSIQEDRYDAGTNVQHMDSGTVSETIYSPRTLEAVNRKKLFFGGFINNDMHFQPVMNDWLQIDKNNDSQAETRRESIAGRTEERTIKMQSRSSSFEQIQKVNDVLDSANACILNDGSSVNAESIEDIDDYMENRVCEDGPMPLELENQSLHLPPPDLSMVDVSHRADESTRIISQQQEPEHDEPDHAVPVFEVEESEIESEKLKTSLSNTAAPIMKQTHPQEQPPDNRSILEVTQVRNAVDNGIDLKKGLSFELRHGQKSSSYPQNSLMTNNNDSSEKSDSLTNNDNDEIDSDEGIELVDEEVVQRALHIPLSPKPSSPSLRIYLPRGDIVYSNSTLESKTSHRHKHRSRITIDLHDLAVNDNESMRDHIDLNGHKRLSSRVSGHIQNHDTKYECSDVNSNIKSPKINQSSSEDTEDQEGSFQNNRRSISPESSTTNFSAGSNESDCNNQTDSFILLNNGEEFHSWSAKEQMTLTKVHIHDSINEYYLPKPPDNPRMMPLSQRKGEPPNSNKCNLKYQAVEAEKLEDNSIKISHEIPHAQKNGMTPKDGQKFSAAGKRTGVGEITSDVYYNHSPHRGFSPKAHIEKLNPILLWDHSRHLQANPALKESEPSMYRKPLSRENKIFAPREQSIKIPESPLRLATYRRLHRSRTSFDLPTVREPEVAPKHSIIDPTKTQPRKRSVSASANRRSATSVTAKSQYTSISVVDLTKSLQTNVSINKNKNTTLTSNHYEVSNMIPLSRILNGSQAKRYGYHDQLDYLVSRNIDKSSVPYFLRKMKITKVLPSDTKTHQKKNRVRNETKRSDIQDNLHNNDITTLMSDYKDPDIIPNDVIFDNVNTFSGHFYRR